MIIDGLVNIFEEVAATNSSAHLSKLFGVGNGMVETSAEKMIAALDEAQVDHALLTTVVDHPGGDGRGPVVPGWTRLGIVPASWGRAVDACDTAGGRLSLLAGVKDPHDVMGTVRGIRIAAEDRRTRGVMVIAPALEMYLTDPRLYPVYATCVELDLPLFTTTGIVGAYLQSKYQDPMLLEDVLIHFPELRIVAMHVGHPWEKLLIRLMVKFPGLHLMTSAWKPKHLDPALVEFMGSSRGDGRVFFASDWPILEPRVAVAQARELPLDDTVLAGYLGENLREFLRLT